MNFGDSLIIINDQDKTDSIETLIYEGDKCKVKFTGNGKVYTYNSVNVKKLQPKSTINLDEVAIHAKGKLLTGVISALHYGEHVRVSFGGEKSYTYSASDITLERNSLTGDSKRIKEYFAQLAEEISLRTEDGASILSKQYESMSFVGENSSLGQYLSRPKSTKKVTAPSVIAFPFGINPSQKDATINALTSQISIIEGPPGTGKTQTILNIIANIILQGKTVAVVSGNNSATANVLEKLAKNSFDFICAYLGSNDNKTQFLAAQSDKYPQFKDWKLAADELKALKSEVTELTEKLNEMLIAKNRTAEIKQALTELVQEQKYFDSYYSETYSGEKDFMSASRMNSTRALQLWLEFENVSEAGGTISLWLRIRNSLLYGLRNKGLYYQPSDRVIAQLQSMFYRLSITELEAELNGINNKLENFRFDEHTKKLIETSMRLFNATLYQQYGIKDSRKKFEKEDLWKNPEQFVKEYPIILSTTYSIKTCLSKDFQFDYVIIDEASQVDLITGALALSCAKNAVIVGDLKQLPNVVTDDNKKAADLLAARYSPDECYNYSLHSLLSSAVAVWTDVPRTLLREHYRCHPKIIGFCNQKFYDNQLIVMTEDKNESDVLAVYYTNPGNHARQRVNQRQLDVIKEEILPELNTSPENIGIVAPYRAQANEAKKQTSDGEEIEADTVHKYQGREKENIIISTVDNQIGEFADNPNLLNVAVSRAISKLRIVISPDEWNKNTNTGDLVRYIRYNNFEVIQSKIYSVFDLLYQSYSEQRHEYLKKHKRISEYDSENLMYSVIENVIGNAEFSNLSVIVHQPLRMVVRNIENFLDEEVSYINHPSTHVDFMIYNKLDKTPVLVVEVDGVSYHAEGNEQKRRDNLKNGILSKCNIPFLRLRTNESGEEKRLHEALTQALMPVTQET